MFYTIFFFLEKRYLAKLNENIFEYYPLLLNKELEFKVENDKTIMITDNLVLSLSEKADGFITTINKLYQTNCNHTCSIDVYGDNEVWSKDLILIVNDLLINTNGDFLLLQYGEYVLLKRLGNQIYIDQQKLDVYPFDLLSQKWQLKNLGFLPFDS